MLDPEMQADLEILKNLLSHTIPGASIKDILKFAVKESIQKRDLQREVKARKREAAPAPVLNKNETPANAEPSAGDMAEKKNVNSANQNPSGAVEIKSSSQISVGMRTPLAVAEKRLVWRKSQGQCCYRHEGRRCSSRFQLQIDHIIPLARDGTNEISNLQLLCRQHNQMKGFHLQK